MEAFTNYIIGTIFAILTAVIAWAAKNYLGISAHGKIMEYVKEGLGYGKKMAKTKLGEGADEVNFDSEVIDQAVNFIGRQAPKWLKKAGVSEEHLVELVTSELENSK